VKKLLITVRDPSPAVSTLNLYKQIKKSCEFQVKILAQSPADRLLRDKIPASDMICLPLEPSRTWGDPQFLLLKENCAAILKEFKPNAVLANLSSLGVGVDEVICDLKNGFKVFCFQDFWGDVNPDAKAWPDMYLVTDEYAVVETRKKFSGAIQVVGKLKYEAYQVGDLEAEAAKGRLNINHLFLGQPLWEISDYGHSLEKFREFVQGGVVYRPHPKESAAELLEVERIFKGHEDFKILRDFSLETLVLNSERVYSSFSTACYDAVYIKKLLRRSKPEVYFWIPEGTKIWETYTRLSGLEHIPADSEGPYLLRQPGGFGASPLVKNCDLTPTAQLASLEIIKRLASE
jgi:hypothetical protein